MNEMGKIIANWEVHHLGGMRKTMKNLSQDS